MRSAAKKARVAAGFRRWPDVALVVGSMGAGGAERVALNLASEFSKRGLAVDLVLVSADGPLAKHVPPNIRILSLKAGRARRAIVKLRRYLKEADPSAVISFTFHINILAALASVGLRTNGRLILSVHSTLSRTLREYPRFARMWMWLATTLLYRVADRIVAVSSGAARDLVRTAQVDPSRVVTIHNPVVSKDFGAAAAEPATHPWLLHKTRPVVLAVGRLTEAKDYPTLIRAFAKLRGVSDARLLILGEGRQRTELEALVRQTGLCDCVELTGHVTNPLPYMKAADVFVLSSKREGFGNVLVEAMAAGAPVISTDCPHGPREILEDGKWGNLVPIGDCDALADVIVAVLRDGGVDARARAKDFTVEAAADQYLRLVQAPLQVIE